MLRLVDNGEYMGLYPCPKCGDFIAVNSKICPSCNASLERKEGIDDKSTSEFSVSESPLFICSKCGAFIGVDATCCNACGTKRTPLTEEINVLLKGDGLRKKESSADAMLSSPLDLYFCDNCGAFVGPNAARCESCGIEIEEGENVEEGEEVEEQEITQGPSSAEEFLSTEGTLLLCDNCGAFISPNSSECGICGVAIKDMKMPFKEVSIEEIRADSKLSSSGALFICDKCGAFVKQGAEECTICGTMTQRELNYGYEDGSLSYAQIDQMITKKILEAPEEVAKKPLEKAERGALKTRPKRTKEEIIDECMRVWYKKAVALRKLGRHKEAIKNLNNALNLSRDDKILILEKADIYYEMRGYTQAVKLYLHLLESEPESIPLLNKVGNALFRLGHQNESLLCFEKALSLDGSNREALINKGYLLMKQERYDEAMEYADKIVVCCS